MYSSLECVEIPPLREDLKVTLKVTPWGCVDMGENSNLNILDFI